ncbi:Aldo/keto reductase [Aspergillus venezuelensis]
MVNTFPFGDIHVPSPGFGAIVLSFAFGSNLNLEVEPVLLKTIEFVYTFWVTAVSYRAGVNEKLLGDFIRKHNSDVLVVASKCGFDVFGDGSVTNSATHIKTCIEGTNERLGFTPDLYYLHRMDPNTPLEESIVALDEIRKAGRTKYIGLSECSAKTLRTANSIAKIDAVQAEYSAFERIHEQDGFIQACKELSVTYVVYGPLGHGWLVDKTPCRSPDDFAADDFRCHNCPNYQGDNFYKNKAIVEEMKNISSRRGCALSQVALAWVAAQKMIAIPGTTKATRLEENWASRDIELTEEQLEIRGIINSAKPHGNRYNETWQAMVGH